MLGKVVAITGATSGIGRTSEFTQALAGFGWIEGRNLRIDVRRSSADTDRIQALAQELVGLKPDIILTDGTPATVAVQRETRTIPIAQGRASGAGAFSVGRSRSNAGRSPTCARWPMASPTASTSK